MGNQQKPLSANLEIKIGDTLYKVTSVYTDKGDFRILWEELIIKALLRKSEENRDKN